MPDDETIEAWTDYFDAELERIELNAIRLRLARSRSIEETDECEIEANLLRGTF